MLAKKYYVRKNVTLFKTKKDNLLGLTIKINLYIWFIKITTLTRIEMRVKI